MTTSAPARDRLQRLALRCMPFADAVTTELPLSRLMRLALFQVSVGMAMVLLTGTLNRVMIVELGVPAWMVAAFVALPLLAAPFRALIGHKSDIHLSPLGWRRSPYIWIGSLLMFGGLAFMPFALLVLSGATYHKVPAVVGQGAAALSFIMGGFGMHTTQTAGLALATDLAPERVRPRVVALLYMMWLVGMGGSAIAFGFILDDYTNIKLIRAVQGAAVVTIVLNLVALWKQEPRVRVAADAPRREQIPFRDALAALFRDDRTGRLLVAVGLGAAGFSMQDVLLEPYGGAVLGLSVSQTTLLTAVFAGGMMAGFALAARQLSRGGDPHRLAAIGAMFGIVAFSLVIFADPLGSATLFRIGTTLIGFGGGLFAVGTLTAAMAMAERADSGLALGAWGAVQLTAMGLATLLGGALRDAVSALAVNGALGPALVNPSTGYTFVYHLEIALLFATLAMIGPLVRVKRDVEAPQPKRFGLADFPTS